MNMSPEVISPIAVMEEYACNLEKKQRNLLKRKTRLETYKETLRSGGNLTPDQEKAITEYESVCQLVDALKETAEAINEIQCKVDRVMKENETRLVAQREKHTIDIFRKICPILELISKAQLPAVKAAIIKASSQQQLKAVENASRVLNVRLPSGFKMEEIDSSNFCKQSAEYLFKLANSSQAPINGKNSKLRSLTFEELRQTCFNLLLNEHVKAALASPLGDVRKNKPNPKQQSSEIKQPTKLSSQPLAPTEPPKMPKSSIKIPLPAEEILNSVIDPLKTNFNFLQASNVGPVASTVVSGEKSTVLYDSQPFQPHLPVYQNQAVAILTSSQVPSAHRVDVVNQKPAENYQSSQNQEVLKMTIMPSEVLVAENVKPGQNSSTDLVDSNKPEQPKQAQPQPVSLRVVADAEVALKQANKSDFGKAKSWADRVRGAQQIQISHPESAQSLEQISAVDQNKHRDQRPLRGKPARNRQSPDQGPSHSPFNSQWDANTSRSMPPRGGFRGRGYGNGGMSFRGGRGPPRGSFHSRGGFDVHAQHQNQAPMQAT